MGAVLKVVLDACVLIPAGLCDVLLRAAEADMYQLLWSEDILEEIRRNLVSKFGLTEHQATHRLDQMRTTFPEAAITGYQVHIESMTTHANDMLPAIPPGARLARPLRTWAGHGEGSEQHAIQGTR